jgi:hypothetical protein
MCDDDGDCDCDCDCDAALPSGVAMSPLLLLLPASLLLRPPLILWFTRSSSL